jgi:hypothetical protein
MAYWSRIEAYQRMRTIILRDVWLIDNDHKEDEKEDASEAGSDEGTPDASPTAEQDGRPQPSSPGHGDNSGNGADAPDGAQGPLAEADDIGRHRTTMREKADAEVEEEFPPVGDTAPEMMHTMNTVLRNLRDQELMDIETNDEGPCHKECFLWRWSNVEYSRHVAARQNTFDRIFEGADRLIADGTPSGTADSERDEKAAWEQTQVLMQGVVDLSDELDEADFQYQARNRSKAWKLDTGWYPTSMNDAMEDPEHAVNKWTRPYQWLRREAISNLRIMQALARPRMTRKVLTPWRGEEPESSDESDMEMQGADLTNEREESEGSDADRKERRPAERLARYYAACYVETPGYGSRLALRMLTSWFDERTAEWMAGECIRAGITMSASEAGIPTVLRASIPCRAYGPRERESLPASQTSPPTMDIYHECATEGFTTLVCSGGDRQHVQ